MNIAVIRINNPNSTFLDVFKDLLSARVLTSTVTDNEIIVHLRDDDCEAQLSELISHAMARSGDPVPVLEVGLSTDAKTLRTAITRARRATERLTGHGFLWNETTDYFTTNKIRGGVSIGVLISQNGGNVFRDTLTHAYDRAQRKIRNYVAHLNIPCDFYSDHTIAFLFVGRDEAAHQTKLLEMRARIGTYTAINNIFGHGLAHANAAQSTTHVALLKEAVQKLGVNYNARRS